MLKQPAEYRFISVFFIDLSFHAINVVEKQQKELEAQQQKDWNKTSKNTIFKTHTNWKLMFHNVTLCHMHIIRQLWEENKL